MKDLGSCSKKQIIVHAKSKFWKNAFWLKSFLSKWFSYSSVASPKFFLSAYFDCEEQYFVLDTVFQSTKRQDMLEIWGAWLAWPPTGYAYGFLPVCRL